MPADGTQGSIRNFLIEKGGKLNFRVIYAKVDRYEDLEALSKEELIKKILKRILKSDEKYIFKIFERD